MKDCCKLALPKYWNHSLQAAVLHVISLAHLAIIYARGWAANSINARVRLQAKHEEAENKILLLQEELHKKGKTLAIYNEYRPHAFLEGRTPNEATLDKPPIILKFEPRKAMQKEDRKIESETQPCSSLKLCVRYHAGRKYLPIFSLKAA